MPILVACGALLATCALILYAVGILMMVFTGKVRRRNVMMQTIAVICDAAGTICMIFQAGNIIPADLHGWLGYTALMLMVIDLVFVYRHRKDGLANAPIRIYALCALVYWIVSYSQGFIKM
jgi:hypothetical protein